MQQFLSKIKLFHALAGTGGDFSSTLHVPAGLVHFLQETLCQHILMLPAAARGYIAPLFSKSTQKTACLWVQIPFYILTCPILGMCLFTSGKIYNFLGTFLTVNSYIPKPISFIPSSLLSARLLPIRRCTSCQNGLLPTRLLLPNQCTPYQVPLTRSHIPRFPAGISHDTYVISF